jgi:hypothetical protein
VQQFFGRSLDYDRFGVWGPSELVDEGLLESIDKGSSKTKKKSTMALRVNEAVLGEELLVVDNALAISAYRLLMATPIDEDDSHRISLQLLLDHMVSPSLSLYNTTFRCRILIMKSRILSRPCLSVSFLSFHLNSLRFQCAMSSVVIQIFFVSPLSVRLKVLLTRFSCYIT